MEVKEIMLLKAFEGIDMLLSKGHINETFINLLYFIKSINEDNLQIGLTDNEIEDLLDEDTVSIFTLKKFPLEEINGSMAKIWEETIKKLPQLWED